MPASVQLVAPSGGGNTNSHGADEGAERKRIRSGSRPVGWGVQLSSHQREVLSLAWGAARDAVMDQMGGAHLSPSVCTTFHGYPWHTRWLVLNISGLCTLGLRRVCYTKGTQGELISQQGSVYTSGRQHAVRLLCRHVV